MTSALHAEGRGFNPRPEYLFCPNTIFVTPYIAGMAKWQGNRFVSGRSRVRSPLPALLVLFRCTVHSEQPYTVAQLVGHVQDNMAEWLRR